MFPRYKQNISDKSLVVTRRRLGLVCVTNTQPTSD